MYSYRVCYKIVALFTSPYFSKNDSQPHLPKIQLFSLSINNKNGSLFNQKYLHPHNIAINLIGLISVPFFFSTTFKFPCDGNFFVSLTCFPFKNFHISQTLPNNSALLAKYQNFHSLMFLLNPKFFQYLRNFLFLLLLIFLLFSKSPKFSTTTSLTKKQIFQNIYFSTISHFFIFQNYNQFPTFKFNTCLIFTNHITTSRNSPFIIPSVPNLNPLSVNFSTFSLIGHNRKFKVLLFLRQTIFLHKKFFIFQ